jgi:uncharacterized protein YndB with AHSA1/START domain
MQTRLGGHVGQSAAPPALRQDGYGAQVQRIEIDRDFDQPVDRVFAYLAEHENLGPLFGASVTRVRDGDTSRNGTGSVRRLRIGPLPSFEETVTQFVPHEVIGYRITRGSPLRDHAGEMTFSSLGSGTRLHYVITFGAVVPGLDRVVAAGRCAAVPRGLDEVARNA